MLGAMSRVHRLPRCSYRATAFVQSNVASLPGVARPCYARPDRVTAVGEVLVWVFACVPLLTAILSVKPNRRLAQQWGHERSVQVLSWTAVALGAFSLLVAAARLVIGPATDDVWFWGAIIIVGIALVRLAVDVTVAVLLVRPMPRGPESRRLTLATLGKEVATGLGAYIGLAPWL